MPARTRSILAGALVVAMFAGLLLLLRARAPTARGALQPPAPSTQGQRGIEGSAARAVDAPAGRGSERGGTQAPPESSDAASPRLELALPPAPASSASSQPPAAPPTGLARSSDARWSQTRLAARDSAPGDEFGAALAIDGDRLAVGAPGARVEGAASGRVHLFRRQGSSWSLVALLAPPEPSEGLRFGAAVACEGERVAVAALHADGRGVVYGYEWRGSPELVRELRPEDGAAGECGAPSLDLRWDRLAVGWRTANGEVASYLADAGWRLEASWSAGPLEVGLGGRVAVGSQVVAASGLRQWGGGAQVFVRAWGVGPRLGEGERPFELAAREGARDGCAVPSVSVTTDSSQAEVTLADGEGLVHRFSNLDPGYAQELRSPSGGADEFGAALSQSGWLVVGAPGDDAAGEDAGCAHVYDHATGAWRLRATLRAEQARASDRLGVAVDADERAAVRFQVALGAVPAARPGYVVVAELPRP